VVAITLVFTLWAVYEFSRFGDVAADMLAESRAQTNRFEALSDLLDSQTEHVLALSASGDSAHLEGFRRAGASFDSALDVLARIPDSTLREVSRPIRKAMGDYDSISSRLVTAAIGDSPRPIQPLIAQHATVLRRIRAAREAAVDVRSYRAEVNAALRSTLLRVTAAIVIAALLGLIGANLYSRWAVRSIDRLRQAVKQVGRGEYAHTVRITTDDELGDLSREFNRMVEQLRHYEGMNLERILLEQRKAEMIVSSITTPIIVVDNGMKIVLANSSAKRLFRRPVHVDVVGDTVEALTHDSQVVATIKRTIDPAEVDSRAYEAVSWTTEEEGEEKHYSLQVFPLRSKQVTGGAIAVFADITELKELEGLKDDLIARLSHEFRTPVSSLMMGLDLLDRDIAGTLTGKQRDIVTGAQADCRRLSTMVQDILDFVQVEGMPSSGPANVRPLQVILSDTLEPYDRQARHESKELVHAIDRSVADCRFDEPLIRLILDNLVSNALRHTRSGDSVTVSASRDGYELVLAVTDTGTGIPADSLDKIFEKFYQVDTGESPAPGSIGLGLAIVREAVRNGNGTITVRSRLNEGTTFTVRLPVPTASRDDTRDRDE
jgi:PAS domain S-box-containing protein